MHSLRLYQKERAGEFISELALKSRDELGEQKAPSSFSCLLLGVPFDMQHEEFETFIEPFIPEFESFQLFAEDQSTYVSAVEARCKMALINFHNESSYNTFCSLYNNLHFPAYRSNPPCLVIPVSNVLMNADNPQDVARTETSIQSESAMATSFGNTKAATSSSSSSSSAKVRRLPLCTVCLRRIKASVTQVCGSNDIPVHTKFGGNGARCLVCRIYGGAHSLDDDDRGGGKSSPKSVAYEKSSSVPDVTKLRRCLTCDLRDNVWVCVICAHTGCGRYTCQHAQHHYEQTGHPFSLELASGRIWDYDYDTFVHVDSGPLDDPKYRSRRWEVMDQYESAGQSTALSDQVAAKNPGKAMDLSQPNTARSDSDVGTPREKSEWFRLRSSSFEEMSRVQATQGLGAEVRDKISAIVDRYERLLEAQLRQQQQYYEKLLSRETSRAFYASLNQSATESVQSSAVHTSSGTQSQDANNTDDNFELVGGLTEEDVNDIVTAKLEISSIEYDTSLLLEKLRNIEAQTRRAQRQNDALLKKKRQHEEKIESLRKLTVERQTAFESAVMDLEQQIRDLSFYTRTQAQLTRSPIRAELEGGQIVGVAPGALPQSLEHGDSIGPPATSPVTNAPASSSSRQQKQSGGDRKKKGGKSPRR